MKDSIGIVWGSGWLIDYRALAESWRVLLAYRLRSRKEIISNCICASMDDPWSVVSFFYPKDGIGNRLSDEDFREIFFLLTDAFPEEVTFNPDPINLLSSLSESEKTTGHAKPIVARMHSILKAEDNEIRAWLIRPLFSRINKRDLHPFFMRLSVRASPIRRRDVIAALGMAYDEPFHHVRTSVNLIGLKNTVNALSMGSFDFKKVRPLLRQTSNHIFTSLSGERRGRYIHPMLCRGSGGGVGVVAPH